MHTHYNNKIDWKFLIFLLILGLFMTFCLTSCSQQKKLQKWCAKCVEKDSTSIITIDTTISGKTIIDADSNEVKITARCDSLNRVVIDYYVNDALSKIKSDVQITDTIYETKIVVKNRKSIDTVYVNLPTRISTIRTYTTINKWHTIPLTKWKTYLLVSGKIFNILLVILLTGGIVKLLTYFKVF